MKCIEIIKEKKLLRKPFLHNQQKCFNADQILFRKEETKCYLNRNFKKGVSNVDYVWMSLKVTSKLNISVNNPTHTHINTHRR